MSFEAKIQAALEPGKTSKSQFVRKAREVGALALIDRIDVMSTLKSINAMKEKDGIPASDMLKQAGKRHALRTALEKIEAGMKALTDAEADIARNTSPIPQIDGGGSLVQIDSELRQAFKSLPEDVRLNLKAPPEMLMAVARAPAILSNIPDSVHARLTDGIRRQLWPEKMAELDNDRRVIEAARTALEMHRETARTSLGLATETHANKVVTAA